MNHDMVKALPLKTSSPSMKTYGTRIQSAFVYEGMLQRIRRSFSVLPEFLPMPKTRKRVRPVRRMDHRNLLLKKALDSYPLSFKHRFTLLMYFISEEMACELV